VTGPATPQQQSCFHYRSCCRVRSTLEERLAAFYRETFWANPKVFRCCQAALALAKRGENIDRCFIGRAGRFLSTMSNHNSMEQSGKCVVIMGAWFGGLCVYGGVGAGVWVWVWACVNMSVSLSQSPSPLSARQRIPV
jgi:hypothetical protein